MKKIDITKEQLRRMQKMRDNKIPTRDIGRIFGCSASFVCRHTTNPKRLKSEEEQERMYKEYLERKTRRSKKEAPKQMDPSMMFVPEPVKRPRKDKEDFDREVRVLSSVPSNFKVPSRVMRW